ncbi:MAG: OmpA family protein [Saonia sp.]
MRNIIAFVLFLLLSSSFLHAQKKSELFAEIEGLKSQLDTTERALNKSKIIEKTSLAKAESLSAQVKELQDANATLLKNLNSFAEVSNKKSDNINKTLASLDEKEKQLKLIKDAIAINDSTTIVVLTNAKQTLGEDAKIGVVSGAVVISTGLTKVFGENSTSVTVEASAEAWLEKIANILTTNPDVGITVEGLSMTGELDLAAQQATAVAAVLQKKFGITADRISALGKDGDFKEGVNLRIHPRFDQFYIRVRENMKNGK